MGKKRTICMAQMKDDLTYHGETVLSYSIEYPVFHPVCRSPLARLNRYYRTLAEQYRHAVTTQLFGEAVRQYRISQRSQLPMPVYQAVVEWRCTYLDGCVASLYSDRYEYAGGAHGITIRASQTWDLDKAVRLPLSCLIAPCCNAKEEILRSVRAQIGEHSSDFFDNADFLAGDTWNPARFYCTPEGLVVYYQQYDIAPYSSGIPEFCIPYTGCVADPLSVCGER